MIYRPCTKSWSDWKEGGVGRGGEDADQRSCFDWESNRIIELDKLEGEEQLSVL